MTQLTGKQRRTLRALAHHLEPIVQIGKDGVTPGVADAVDHALTDHELIKVRVLESCPAERTAVAEQLGVAVRAMIAGTVGRIAILYRRHPETPRIQL